MTDIRELLDRTALWTEGTPSSDVVETDVLRGRVALRQRRRGRAIWFSVAGMVAAAALVGTTIVADPTPPPRAGAQNGAGLDGGTLVHLVAYRGEQLEGFIVDRVPDGWYLQSSTPINLVIAPVGDTTHPDAYVGKLVVLLRSSIAPQELPEGDPVKVGEFDGVVTHTPEADTLTYEDDAGHFVQIQAWREALGWTNQQLVLFAEGVTVTANVQPNDVPSPVCYSRVSEGWGIHPCGGRG
jgi:hypothetical protein